MGYEVLKSKFAEPGFIASFSSGVLSGAVSTCLISHYLFHRLNILRIIFCSTV